MARLFRHGNVLRPAKEDHQLDVADKQRIEATSGIEPDGTLPNPNTFLRRFKALAKQVGLPAIAVHGVRHTYITSAFDANLDESVISDRAGHSDSRITRNVYRHTIKRKDVEAAEAVASAFYEGTG